MFLTAFERYRVVVREKPLTRRQMYKFLKRSSALSALASCTPVPRQKRPCACVRFGSVMCLLAAASFGMGQPAGGLLCSPGFQTMPTPHEITLVALLTIGACAILPQIVWKYFTINKKIQTTYKMAADITARAQAKRNAATRTTRLFTGMSAWYTFATIYVIVISWMPRTNNAAGQGLSFIFMLDSCLNPVLCTYPCTHVHACNFVYVFLRVFIQYLSHAHGPEATHDHLPTCTLSTPRCRIKHALPWSYV